MATLEAERNLVANLDVQIMDLEREIPVPEHSLSALRAQRTLAQAQLDSYKYPVLTLPNEIVSEIFVHFLPVYPEPALLAGPLSPTSLTHICRKWRDIALATPTLWRAAYLSIDDPDEEDEMDDSYISVPFVQQLHKLDVWLKRSRCCPLSIEIEETFNSPRNFFFSSAQCARWEYLRVSLVYRPFLAIAGPLPLLRHLDIAVEELARGDRVVFPEAPLLRSVILNDLALDAVILPWAQLTSLTMECMDPEQCFPVLQQTSNLVDCQLRIVGSTGPWPDVTLPRLESLALVRSYIEDMVSGYLENLIAPALRDLHIEEKLLGLDPIHSLTSFISKSGCKLREMHIYGKRSVSRDTYSRAFPSIRLSFHENYDGEEDTLSHDNVVAAVSLPSSA